MPTAILLIDNSNIHIGTMKMFGKSARFSYMNFEKKYSDYTIQKKSIFGSTPPKNDAFWGHMEKKGYEVFTYERKAKFDGGTREKGVDGAVIARGVDAIKDHRPDVVVLLSGDLDMRALIEVAQENGCEVHVWSYKESLASEIEANCHKCYYIDDNLIDFVYFQREDSSTEPYLQHMERQKREQEEKAQQEKEQQERFRQEQEEQERLRQEKKGEERRKAIEKIGRNAIGIVVLAIVAAVIKEKFF